MQQKQQLEQSPKIKEYRYRDRPVQSLIYKKLKQEGQIATPLLSSKQDKVPSSTTSLPSISQKGIHSLNPMIRFISKSQHQIPKINPILKYNSQKWQEQNRAKNEELHLYKGKKKFKIETISLSQSKDLREPRNSLPNKLMLSFKKNNHELYTQISKQNRSRKSLAFLPVLTEPEPPKPEPKPKKSIYFRPEEVAGWQTFQDEYDSYH